MSRHLRFDDYSARSGESEKLASARLIGITALHYNWCYECASAGATNPPVPPDVEDVSMRGNTLARCSFCGRRMSEVQA